MPFRSTLHSQRFTPFPPPPDQVCRAASPRRRSAWFSAPTNRGRLSPAPGSRALWTGSSSESAGQAARKPRRRFHSSDCNTTMAAICPTRLRRSLPDNFIAGVTHKRFRSRQKVPSHWPSQPRLCDSSRRSPPGRRRTPRSCPARHRALSSVISRLLGIFLFPPELMRAPVHAQEHRCAHKGTGAYALLIPLRKRVWG